MIARNDEATQNELQDSHHKIGNCCEAGDIYSTFHKQIAGKSGQIRREAHARGHITLLNSMLREGLWCR